METADSDAFTRPSLVIIVLFDLALQFSYSTYIFCLDISITLISCLLIKRILQMHIYLQHLKEHGFCGKRVIPKF